MEVRRTASQQRKTRETAIAVDLCVDGSGAVSVETGIGFFDHMLTALAFHGGFDLRVQAEGDLHIDAHHTMEDVGLVFGEVFRKALGNRAGIRRFGAAFVPMDEALVRCVVDISGRPFLAYEVPVEALEVGGVPVLLFREFFRAFATKAAITLHITALAGDEGHHVFEAAFKATGRALAEAVSPDPRQTDVPSSKGTLD